MDSTFPDFWTLPATALADKLSDPDPNPLPMHPAVWTCKSLSFIIQDAMRRGNAASLFFRVSCGRKVLETGKARIRELILALVSEVHFLGHDFERFEIMA